MGKLSGNFGAGSKRDVEKEQRPRALGKRSRGFALTGGLKASGNSGGVESLQRRRHR